MQIAGPFSTCQAALLRASACFSLLDMALHWNVLFSVSFGAWLELLPIAVSECELPCATGPLHKCLSVGGGTCHTVSLATQPQLGHAAPETPHSTARTALAESCSPQQRKNPAVTSQGSHREGDLLTQSKPFIFSLVGGGSGWINKGCSESE